MNCLIKNIFIEITPKLQVSVLQRSFLLTAHHSAVELAGLDLEVKGSQSSTVGLSLGLCNYSFCYAGSSIQSYFVNSQQIINL